jgi:phosphate-selective porin OprO and OprP
MRRRRVSTAFGLSIWMALAATAGMAQDHSFLGDWPTHHTFADGTDFGAGMLYQYDVDDFSHDDGHLQDAATNRRKYLGLYLKNNGIYDAKIEFDYQSRKWQDAYLRLQSGAFLGRDIGAFQFGQSKTPVSLEGNTSSSATTFIELALPSQVVYENRRVGVDWALSRPGWLASVGYYGGDLQGDNDGRTLAGRFAWVPFDRSGDVVHLGVTASRESRDATTDGAGVVSPPSARFRTTPEAGLSSLYLVDSGSLVAASRIDRYGLEGLWIRGPWSLQSEYLQADTRFDNGKPDYHVEGYYAFASWVLTGESRPYRDGNVGNIVPSGKWGAFELALRYSSVNLDDGGVRGGRERDWTLGANWYLGRHLKFQANYIRAFSDRKGLAVDPRVVECRAQILF